MLEKIEILITAGTVQLMLNKHYLNNQYLRHNQ